MKEMVLPKLEGLNKKEQKRPMVLNQMEKGLLIGRRNNLIGYSTSYPELKKAWVLKESFRAWYREIDRMRAENCVVNLSTLGFSSSEGAAGRELRITRMSENYQNFSYSPGCDASRHDYYLR